MIVAIFWFRSAHSAQDCEIGQTIVLEGALIPVDAHRHGPVCSQLDCFWEAWPPRVALEA